MKKIILPKATFASYTGTLANLFVYYDLTWDTSYERDKLVYMPIAKWDKNKDERRKEGTYKFRYRLPAATFESMTYSTNILDSWGIHDWFIMPMMNLNLKSLIDATGMFHWCSLDLETLRAIAYGPADLEDPDKGLKDWTGDSATHTITLGILKELEGTTEVAQILADIRAKNWTVVEEYNERVYEV